jgi:hypothetical protein
MNCKEFGCKNQITARSKSGLCKVHYSYLWKSLNKDRAALHSKATYNKNKEFYIKVSASRRTISRRNNPDVKLRDSLRRRLNNALKNTQKVGSAVDDLGCSISELRLYLESKFLPGMGWDNYGLRGWHIDHIEPLSKFDLQDPEQLKKACHYTNLQPMWAQDNLKKSNHVK